MKWNQLRVVSEHLISLMTSSVKIASMRLKTLLRLSTSHWSIGGSDDTMGTRSPKMTLSPSIAINSAAFNKRFPFRYGDFMSAGRCDPDQGGRTVTIDWGWRVTASNILHDM